MIYRSTIKQSSRSEQVILLLNGGSVNLDNYPDYRKRQTPFQTIRRRCGRKSRQVKHLQHVDENDVHLKQADYQHYSSHHSQLWGLTHILDYHMPS